MNMNGIHVEIMWKEIAIILLIICLLRYTVDFYLVYKYKKLNNAFLEGRWEGLEEKLIKHRGICNIFSEGPFNRNIRVLYNGLCVALASIAYVRQDEEMFLYHLNYIKREDEYEMKAFILSLYYHAKKNEKKGEFYYKIYLNCSPKGKRMRDILEYIYGERQELLPNSLESFRNPAIIKLFHENNIINDEKR